MDRLGRLELYGYSRRGELALSVLTYSPREKSWQAFTFELEPAPPHKLAGINVSPAAGGDKLFRGRGAGPRNSSLQKH